MKTTTVIRLTIRQLLFLISTLIILTLFVLLGTAISHELSTVPKGPASKFVLNQLNLAKENVIAAWFSSMLFFLVAVAALLCYFTERQQVKSLTARFLNVGWLVFGFIFLTLSLDEIGSFHELIGETTFFQNIGFGEAQGWNSFFALIVLVSLFMIFFYVPKIKTSIWSFVLMITGTLLFLSNPFQEQIEIAAYRGAADPVNWKRPTALLLLEEGSELFGALCFLGALIVYTVKRARKLGTTTSGISLHLTAGRQSLINYTVLFLILPLLMLIVLHANAGNIIKGDDGIAENWFASTTFFVVALIALYKIINNNYHRKSTGHWLLAFYAFCYAAYFGSNIYASELIDLPVISQVSIHHLLLIISMCIGVLLFFYFPQTRSRIALTGFFCLTLLQQFNLPPQAFFTGYAAAALLLVALVTHHISPQKEFVTTVTRKEKHYSDSNIV